MPEAVSDQKKSLRGRVCAALGAMPPDELREKSKRAWRRALDAGLITENSGVMLYAPIDGVAEIDLTGLAADLHSRGCRLCVPRIEPKTRAMTLARVANLTDDLVPDLSSRLKGLKMARPDAPAVSPADLDTIVVPGVAFDATGARLGRGAGYYDRFLAALPGPRPLRLALTLDEQVVDWVPVEIHDQRVHIIVTPTRMIHAPQAA